ncbi:Spy/CpxP family protein refolding chaperone [Nostoc sp. MS1]|uniref:Spy/CpxP family protein refolding chaperone n=1 Tax=Nostoc sp. MS1 TaxID=2764711 RepID=UPI001CC58E3F|nr:hypothetical protein [Nostoc sp. MS1]BCL34309.1 hypothetical protein NSMS1_07560 [Nostoc sp. MS1]
MWLRRSTLLGVILVSCGINFALAKSQLQSSVTQMSQQNSHIEVRQFELNQLLNLTPEQQERLQNNLNQYQGEIEKNQQALHQVSWELVALMEGTATLDEIREKHAQLQQLSNSIENMRFESMLVMRELLTPTQRQQVFEKLHNFSNRPNNVVQDNNSTLQVIRYQ